PPPACATLSLHDALPIYHAGEGGGVPRGAARHEHDALDGLHRRRVEAHVGQDDAARLRGDAAAEGVGDGARLLVDLLEHEVPVADRKSTRLNSSHQIISY